MSTPLRYVSLGECTGYGLAALEYVAALLPLAPDLAWQPLLRHRRVGYGWFGPRPSRLVAARIFGDRHAAIDRIVDAPAPQRQVLHSVPELWPRVVDPGAANFGYTVWETDRLP